MKRKTQDSPSPSRRLTKRNAFKESADAEDLRFLRWLERVAPKTMATWRNTYKDCGGNPL